MRRAQAVATAVGNFLNPWSRGVKELGPGREPSTRWSPFLEGNERGARMVPRCESGVGPGMGAQKVALGARGVPAPGPAMRRAGEVKARNLPSLDTT